MPSADPPKPIRFHTSMIGILLGLGFALYVYRFPVGDANITALRIAMLVLGVALLWLLARSERKYSTNYLVLAIGVVVLGCMNAYWYSTLDEYPIPQREMISHLINLILMLEIVVYINSERQLLIVLNGYLLAAVIAIAIGYYAFFFKEIPFEELLRTLGPNAAKNISYVIEDGDFLRLSGPFMDPNFFGIYLLSVLTFSLWMYRFRSQNKFYLALAITSLVTLPLTISRTAMVGLSVFMVTSVLLLLPRRYLKSMLIGSLFVSALTTFALAAFFPEFLDRLVDPESMFDRIRFISVGIEAFEANPLFGSGPSSIVDEATGIATAHLMYLSILAKFGVVGAVPYFVFVFFPLWKVLARSRLYLKEYRALVVCLYIPMCFMYFLYDFLYFLEFQYLIFAVGYSVVLSSYAKRRVEERVHSTRNSRPGTKITTINDQEIICAE